MSKINKNISQNPKKISIVMSSINRRKQLEFTIKTLQFSKHKNIEIIVWDDGSDSEEQIDDFIDKYGIKLFKVNKNEKIWSSPVIGYNNAIMKATGDIVIIQNPEVCHFDDIIQFVNDNLEYNEYLSFSCYALANINENNKLYNMMSDYNNYQKNYNNILSMIVNDTNVAGNTIHSEPKNGWVNHPIHLPVGYHYTCALYRDKLLELGGFDSDYEYGFCHDDDDFVRRIQKNNMTAKIINKYCIHQWHPSQIKVANANELWKINQKVFWNKMSSYNLTETFDRNIIFKQFKRDSDWPSKIPKILHLYWNGNQFTILHLMTVKSFMLYNPDWIVNVYYPKTTKNTVNPTWKSTEQKYVYNGPNFLELLKTLNINYISIDFDEIGFFNDANDVYKSDYLRWYLLYNHGGMWSDFDVLYIKKITGKLFETSCRNCEIKDIEQGIYYFDSVFPIGLLMASKNNIFFKKCCENSLKYYNTDNYQSIGACMWNSLFKDGDNVLNTYKNTCILSEKTVYPYKWNGIQEFFDTENAIENEKKYYDLINSDTVGIHWFNGAEVGKKFCCNPINMHELSIVCRLLRKMENKKWKNKFINFNKFSFIPLHRLKSDSIINNNTHIRATKEYCEKNNSVGFNSNGDIITVNNNYSLLPYINILDDWNGCFVNCNIFPKISIICVCDNSKLQTVLTLNSFEKSSYKNIEVIIIDIDNKNNDSWEDVTSSFPFIIKIKTVNGHGAQNFGYYYNIGLQYAGGQIILFQNSLIYHVNDILSHISKYLKNDNCISYFCLSITNKNSNDYLNNIHDSGNNKSLLLNDSGIVPCYNVCFAIHKKNIDNIRGFSPEYKFGHGFYIDDFILKINYDLTLKIISPTDYLTVHQHHDNKFIFDDSEIKNYDHSSEKWIINKSIYLNKKEKKIILSKSLSNIIPKIFSCFYSDSNLSYMKYLTIRSFIYYNPNWIINVYVPTIPDTLSKYIGKNHWNNLLRLPNVNVIKINFDDIGFYNNSPITARSNYLQWYILSTTGGMWSDLDILYINSIENTILKINPDFDTLICNVNDQYYPIKLFLSKPNNRFFYHLKQETLKNYNHQNKTLIPTFIKNIWSSSQLIIDNFPENKFLIEDKYIYLPFEYNNINELYSSTNLTFTKTKTIGVCWFGGSDQAFNLQNNIDKLVVKNDSILLKLINKFVKIIENDNYNINIVPLLDNYI
ncbi:putative glycosyltransferase [Cotonvirus japonicus]|uniref:Glycosyltransferase n=1 Tax=Cotonvirus japonicus TaxID=2811091 RepID=A0ABM7NSW1_9VIRU|nr:putative glycosyltransferase [Cotonvirus japonicus]BCS83206.1 putative glycosyltransferase [Cotonvirus japonicus]